MLCAECGTCNAIDLILNILLIFKESLYIANCDIIEVIYLLEDNIPVSELIYCTQRSCARSTTQKKIKFVQAYT